MTKVLALFLLAIPLLVGTAPKAKAEPSAGELVDLVMEAYGGREALAKVQAYRMEGSILAGGRQGTAPFTRIFRRPDHLLVDLRYPDNPEQRLLAGKLGWRTGLSGTLVAVKGSLLDSMVLQAARADLPWILDDRRREVRIGEKAGARGNLPVLELTPAPGLTLRVALDPKTHLIAVSEGTMLDTPMGGGGFAAVYSDYRKVDGCVFPFKETTWALGQMTGEMVVEELVLNPELGERDFQP